MSEISEWISFNSLVPPSFQNISKTSPPWEIDVLPLGGTISISKFCSLLKGDNIVPLDTWEKLYMMSLQKTQSEKDVKLLLPLIKLSEKSRWFGFYYFMKNLMSLIED